MAEEGFGTVAEELRQNRLEQRRANALTEKILEDRYKDDLPAERFKDNLFEIVNDRLINTKLMSRITAESGDVETLNASSNLFLSSLIAIQEGIFLQQANYFAQMLNINAKNTDLALTRAVQFDKGIDGLGRTQQDALDFFIANFKENSKIINESISKINEEEKASSIAQLEIFEENEKKEEKRFAFFTKINEKIGKFTVDKLGDLKISIKKNLKGLASFIFKPLTSLAKGIKELPNKILGFFGTTFGIIGRLALLGVGIFALSRLTDFLRNVGPGGQQSFVDSLMKVYDIARLVLLGLKDVIVDVVIPALVLFGNAVFGIVKFLAQKGLLPGIDLGEGKRAERREKIKADFLKNRPMGATDEDLDKLIDVELEKQTTEAFKKFVMGKEFFRKQTVFGAFGDLSVRIARATTQKDIMKLFENRDKEIFDELKRQFDLRESDKFFIGGREMKSFKTIDEIKKNMGNNINIINSSSKQDNTFVDNGAITVSGDPNAINTD